MKTFNQTTTTLQDNVSAPLTSETLPKAKRKKPSCHRHYKPKYKKKLVNIPVMNRIKGKLLSFDWHKCAPMVQLREKGGKILVKYSKEGDKIYRYIKPRRASIREEREETLDKLLLAIMNNVEYAYGAKYLHECMLSVKELAKEIGQLHSYDKGYQEEGGYRHGRVSYDPVLNALDDLEAAGLVVVVREFDKESAQYKASRIFLAPLMFQSLGMTGKDTKKLMDDHKKYNHKNSKPKFRRSRPLSNKIANITGKGLLSIFDYHRRWFNGELEAETLEEKYTAQLKQFVGKKELSLEQKLTIEYNQMLNDLPQVLIFRTTDKIKAETPDISQADLQKALIDRLKH